MRNHGWHRDENGMHTMRVVEVLQKAQHWLEACGVSQARLDAELLLASCMNVADRAGLYRDLEKTLTLAELDRMYELVERRSRREPIAYILGRKEFWSINLAITRDVLIPRPETESLVEAALEVMRTSTPHAGFWNVLELGTGSGAIALALAISRDDTVVCAVDVSLNALRVARENVSRLHREQRIKLVCGDWLTPFGLGSCFDMVVSNPPYIPSGEIERLAPEIRDYEPRTAVDGGHDGLDFYRRMIPVVPAIVHNKGWIIFELGAGQAPAVRHLCGRSNRYDDITVVPDYAHHERVLVARRK